MELSLAGLVGAAVGTVIAVINYGVLIGYVERGLRRHDTSQTPQERHEFERKLGLMRRLVLTSEIALFAAVGYWFGSAMAG